MKSEYKIPFVGLKLGQHTFEFEVTDAFFDSFDYSLVTKGNVKVTLELEKKETMMIGNYLVEGEVELECGRCTDPMMEDVYGEYRLVYKFDNEPSDDESLVIVYPEEFEIDVRDKILELISVSLPARSVHDEGECNEDMVDLMDEYVVNADVEFDEEEYEEAEEEDMEQEIDPRWAALKKIKNK